MGGARYICTKDLKAVKCYLKLESDKGVQSSTLNSEEERRTGHGRDEKFILICKVRLIHPLHSEVAFDRCRRMLFEEHIEPSVASTYDLQDSTNAPNSTPSNASRELLKIPVSPTSSSL